jgi:hypothetical protein
MSLNGTNYEKKQRPIPPQGPQVAVCYSIIDLGTHAKSFQGQPAKNTPLVHISWEFPNLPHQVFDETKGPQPLAIFQEYTCMLGDKSKLTKMLKSWRQRVPMDLATELPQFLGQPCLINVEYNRDKDKPEIIYANVGSKGEGVMPMMAGTQVGQPSNKRILFNLDNYSHEQYLALPTWIQKKIATCQEWPSILAKFGAVPQAQTQNTQQPNTNFQQQGYQQPANNGFQQQAAAPQFQNQQQPQGQATGFQTTHTIPAQQQNAGVGFGGEIVKENPFEKPPF